MAKGQCGELHPGAKLTARKVMAIRRSVQVNRVLAKKYGVSPRVVSAARIGATWKHLLMPALTKTQYYRKMVLRGRCKAKLTIDDVLQIRKDPRSCIKLSKIYRVHRESIANVKKFKVYKWVRG